jgi:hypothetical protein
MLRLAEAASALIAAIAALTGAVCFTIRRTLIAIPGSIATYARRLMLHLSINWPWQQAWTAWYNRVCGRPSLARSGNHPCLYCRKPRRLSNQDQPSFQSGSRLSYCR